MDGNQNSEVDRIIAERFSTLRAEEHWQPNMQRGLARLRERRAASQERGRRWIFVAVGTAAACVPIMALPVTRVFASRCVSVCVQETAVMREALLGGSSRTLTNTALLEPGNRRPAPDFMLTDANGRNVRLADARGKVVLLNFWATWCKPCGEETPWFVEMQKENQARGFTVLGVAMDEGGWGAVKQFITAKQVNYPVMLGNDRVAAAFGGLNELPLTLIIDREGRIAAIHAGLCRKDEYESDISALLNER